MAFPGFTRRRFAAASFAVLLAAPLAGAWAAPFASDRITVKTEGSGPDVILVPGLNSSPRTWAATVAAVPGYRYHLVQVSGFAGQPAGANRDGDVAAPVAEEIARYIQAAGLRKPALVGHSMGGTIGLMVAARHPDAVSRLMVVDMLPHLGVLFAGPGAPRERLVAIADRMGAARADLTPEQRKASATAMINGMANDPAMIPVGIEDSLASDPAVTSHAYRELILTDLGPELPRITVPVTVLYVVPKGAPIAPERIDGVYKASYAPLPQAVLKRIPDSAHFIMWDQPARFQAELKTFLDGR